jgi:glycosyltransferase involved in cell wall biosynthesis
MTAMLGARGGCRVLHVVWGSRIGGIELHVARLVERLPGHAVCFLNGEGEVAAALEAKGLAFRLGIRRGWAPRSVWRLARALRSARPGIIHLHSIDSLAATLVTVLSVPHAARVYTEHGRSLHPSRKVDAAHRILRAFYLRFVALTPSLEVELERFGFDPERIVLVPNFVDVPRGPAALREPARTVGAVCRLVPVKRVDLLIDVVAELRRRGVDCRAILVGDGVERPHLEERAAAAGIARHILFAGEQSDVLPWLDRMDVLLATSEAEAFATAVVEAMARGVPVVAMAHRGGSVDHVRAAGRLLPDRDVETAADAVAELLRSSDAREDLRHRGYALAAKHAPDIVFAKLEELYAEVERSDREALPAGRRCDTARL